MIEYDPQPPFGGIDWDSADLHSMAPVVDQLIYQALADHPDMIARLTGEAVPSLPR